MEELRCDRCDDLIYSNSYEYEDETVCNNCRDKDLELEMSRRAQHDDFMRYGNY